MRVRPHAVFAPVNLRRRTASPPIMADLFVDIFFLLDILRNFRQSSYNAEGKLVHTPWKIAKGYLQTVKRVRVRVRVRPAVDPQIFTL